MQPKAPIENSLQELQRLYDSAVDASHKTYYSKLALLELCGWLEDNFDDILLTFCSSRISAKANQEYLSKTIIDRTHGCSYADHFRHMLIRVIGLINTEKLESSLDGTGELSAMSARLGNLWCMRKKPAHSSTVGTMPTLDSPTIIIDNLNYIYPVLVKIELGLGSF